MDTTRPRTVVRLEYEAAAEAYLRSLPPEHFMEAMPQATQRAITLASLALVQERRPEVQIFNELLVQYPLADRSKKGQVVPDNMVVVWPEPIKASGSYDVPFQPTAPFLTLEYVSKGSQRKDYEVNFQKYEQELRVPYYLLFYPDVQDLTLYRLQQNRYESVKPNAVGRYPIPELEMEIGLVGGWARFWFRGELLPLPGELLRRVDKMAQQLEEATRRVETEKQRADEEKRRALLADQRADEEKRLAVLADQRADEEKRLAVLADQRADEEKRLALLADQRADEEKRLALLAEQRADEEKQRALLAEQELVQLRAQLAQLRSQPGS